MFRVGEYKSAVEPFLRNDMSPEAKESRTASTSATSGAAGSPTWPRPASSRRRRSTGIIDGMVGLLRDAGGDVALVAKETGLVDSVGGRGDLEKRLIALVLARTRTSTRSAGSASATT